MNYEHRPFPVGAYILTNGQNGTGAATAILVLDVKLSLPEECPEIAG